MCWLARVCVWLLLVTASAQALAQEPAPAPALDVQQLRGWDTEHYAKYPHPHRIGLMIAGFTSFGAGYVSSLTTYAIYSDRYKIDVLIPVAGPWLALASAHWGDLDKPSRLVSQGIVVLQGIAQAVGLTLSIIGVLQYESSRARASRSAPTYAWALVPARGGALAQFAVGF